MWCINTEFLGSCILWIIAIVTFIMMVILVVAFTQLRQDIQRLNIFYRDLEEKVCADKSKALGFKQEELYKVTKKKGGK